MDLGSKRLIVLPAEAVAILKTSCVYGNRFNPEENKRVVETELDRVACPVTRDSLIISRMNTPELAREAHQLRDAPVAVEDPVGGGRGFGNLETMIMGAFPERGLTAESSFL